MLPWMLSRATLEDAVVVVVDEVEVWPGRLVAARQGDLPPVEGVELLAALDEKRKARIQSAMIACWIAL